MGRKSPARIFVDELCKKFPKTASRTLARRAAEEYSITLERARCLVRTARGNHGGRMKPHASVPRENGKSGTVPKMPPSVAEKWTPHEFHHHRVGIISDCHIPYHCETALQSAIKHLKGHSIDSLLINGDFCDFYTISRWVKNPKKRDFKAERVACIAGLEWIRHEFPKIPILFKAGNHEERWDHWLWNHAPEISDEPEMRLDAWLKLDQFGMDFVTDQRPVMVAKLPVFHGHELGKSVFSPVNPARGAFLRTHHTVLIGHSHQTSGHADTNLWHEETFIWSTGCLCDMNPEYARINRWNHGFACVTVGDGGDYDVENFRINSSSGRVRKS